MRCQLCDREVESLERHHLVPRKGRSGKRPSEAVVLVCAQCGDQVHMLFDNKTLRDELNTIDALRANPDMARYLDWIRRKPDTRFPVRKRRLK